MSSLKPWQILLAIGIGSFCAVFTVLGLAALGFLYLVYLEMQSIGNQWSNLGSIANVSYYTQGPARVTVNEPFTLELVIENTHSDSQQLLSVQNYSNLVFHRSDPAWKIRQGDDRLIYELDIPAGAQQIIQIEASAPVVGWQEANIDIHINEEWNFVEAHYRVDVLPKDKHNSSHAP